MKKILVFCLIITMIAIIVSSAPGREINSADISIVDQWSAAGKYMSDFVGPATATVDILYPWAVRVRGDCEEVSFSGSGVFISPCHILTCWHVVEIVYDHSRDENPDNDYEIRIDYFINGEINYYNARIVGGLPGTEGFGFDYAILEIKDGNFPYLKLGNSNDVHTGQYLFSIGSPLDLKETAAWFMVANIAPTAPDLYKRNPGAICIVGPVNPGFSGAPAINTRGGDCRTHYWYVD